MAEALKQKDFIKYPNLQRTMERYYFNLETLWSSFERISRKLESLAHKQLRKVKFSEEDNWFISSYGPAIAKVMLYGGDSYEAPNDDAPKVVDIFSNPNPDVNAILYAAVARPRSIYVLYPWHGKKILCEGAVMPYYEFTCPERLNDQEWMKMLDSDKRPAPPAWLKDIVDKPISGSQKNCQPVEH